MGEQEQHKKDKEERAEEEAEEAEEEGKEKNMTREMGREKNRFGVARTSLEAALIISRMLWGIPCLACRGRLHRPCPEKCRLS